MHDDHVTGLADAIQSGDDAEARRHVLALCSIVLGCLNSMALSLAKLAEGVEGE